MDFLDPKRKKAHRRRLLLGYVLMSIAIALGTFILLLTAYGFDVDRKTGSVIRNGIVFVDSRPGDAEVYINDKRHNNNSSTRLDLPGGQYTLKLQKKDYRNWQRTFFLDGGQIQRLVYPLLIPNTLTPTDVQLYGSAPTLATQSPDRKWLLVQQPGQTYVFDMFDTANINSATRTLTIPGSVISDAGADASLEVIEWSNDNRHFLVKRAYSGKTEYLIVDREEPAESININTALGITPVEVSLRNKKADQLYYVDGEARTLRSADTKSKTISAPIVSGVLAYKTYGDDILLYATQADVEKGRTEFRIRENNKSYPLKTVPQGEVYLVDVSRYDGNWYYAVGSDTDDAVFVYKNPLPTLKGQSNSPLNVAAVLRIENPQFLSFSATVQFIAVQSGNDIVTYDIYDDRQFTLALKQDIPLTQKIRWMDGHRLAYPSGNKAYTIDFDGSNEQELVSSLTTVEGPFFDRDYENLYTLSPSAGVNGRFSLSHTPLRVK